MVMRMKILAMMVESVRQGINRPAREVRIPIESGWGLCGGMGLHPQPVSTGFALPRDGFSTRCWCMRGRIWCRQGMNPLPGESESRRNRDEEFMRDGVFFPNPFQRVLRYPETGFQPVVGVCAAAYGAGRG
jgi:hypothetical protein